jgi:predicted DNA-binding transcriptional regulator YafY
MADTSSRMLELLALLQLHRYWRGPELAERLEVSHRTLRRDIDRLRSLGYAIESVRGVEGGYQMSPGANLPPMVFTHDEAIALAIGLRDVAHGTDAATAEASLRALSKLTAILPPAVRRQIELMQHVTEGSSMTRSTDQPAAHVLGTVAQACQDTVRLRFGYSGYQDDSPPVERYIEPYRLVTRGRRWYLVAFDLDRSDWRTFRVDRMTDPVPTRNSFTLRALPARDLAQYVAERIRDLRSRHEVEFTVHADVDEVQAHVGRWATVTSLHGGHSRVVMIVEDLDWVLHILLSLNATVTVTTPELFAHLNARATLLKSIIG